MAMHMLMTLLLAIATTTQAQSVPGCGELRGAGQFGPFDYRAERFVPYSTFRTHAQLLDIVEQRHFTPAVEMGLRGEVTIGMPAGDMAYTLMAFPNHHRALISIMNYAEKKKTDQPQRSTYTIECWLKRAIAFQPDDHIARLIYADYLVRKRRDNDASQQLEYVTTVAGDNAFTHNNIGMVYFDMKNYEKALSFAHKAIQLGIASPLLADRLKEIGKWVEPAQ